MTDLIGLELDEARTRAQRAGCTVHSVTESRSPLNVELTGPLRVVRVRMHDGGVDLVVTRERYVPH